MTIRIHNSLTKQKEEFKPLDPAGKEVKMYVCGPTVYDEPHIGHLRSAYVFDVMRRYLEYSGYKVKFVRNVTDVDDKIIEKARESKPADLLAEVQAVSDKYLKLYKDDLTALGIQEPTVEPKATGHIQDMQWLIQKLVDGGKAYVSDGDVYFDVNHFQGYGKLSHQNKEAILQNVRIEKNEKKRDTLDFALWKKVKDGEPSWPSPWGAGRPGWHIECSAMSMKYLGETFDIHGGGRDLIFPHHENEVAQSESVTGSQFAKYWIHHGLITVNEQKMSKSLKNFTTLKQIMSLGQGRAEDLKFLFLGTHYSAPLDYSEEKMKMARSVRERFANFLLDSDGPKPSADFKNVALEEFEKLFREAMDHDFNTPQAISIMHELVLYTNKHESETGKHMAAAAIRRYADIMGLSFGPPSSGKKEQKSDEKSKMIELYVEARNAKDFKKADLIRDEFLKKYNFHLSVDKKGGISLREA